MKRILCGLLAVIFTILSVHFGIELYEAYANINQEHWFKSQTDMSMYKTLFGMCLAFSLGCTALLFDNEIWK